MTAIGRLDRRLVLEAPQATADGAGGSAVAWTAVATVWAEVRSQPGGERLAGEAVTAEVTHRVRIRRRGDVRPSMRFLDGSRVLDIRSVVDDGRRWLLCLCQEKPVR